MKLNFFFWNRHFVCLGVPSIWSLACFFHMFFIVCLEQSLFFAYVYKQNYFIIIIHCSIEFVGRNAALICAGRVKKHKRRRSFSGYSILRKFNSIIFAQSFFKQFGWENPLRIYLFTIYPFPANSQNIETFAWRSEHFVFRLEKVRALPITFVCTVLSFVKEWKKNHQEPLLFLKGRDRKRIMDR